MSNGIITDLASSLETVNEQVLPEGRPTIEYVPSLLNVEEPPPPLHLTTTDAPGSPVKRPRNSDAFILDVNNGEIRKSNVTKNHLFNICLTPVMAIVYVKFLTPMIGRRLPFSMMFISNRSS